MLFQKLIVILISSFFAFIRAATVGKLLQVPDKDPSLKSIVYNIGLPNANDKIRDTVYWVPATTQFSARRITVINGNRPYSTWSFDMLLQKSDCQRATTNINNLQSCKAVGGTKLLCNVHASLFDGDYSTAESEVYCSRV